MKLYLLSVWCVLRIITALVSMWHKGLPPQDKKVMQVILLMYKWIYEQDEKLILLFWFNSKREIFTSMQIVW